MLWEGLAHQHRLSLADLGSTGGVGEWDWEFGRGCGGALGSAGRVIARAGAGLVLPGWELTDRLNCGVDVVDHQSRACVIRYPAQSLQTADILRGTEGG